MKGDSIMADNSNNRTILIVIALVLIAILGVLVLQATEKTPEEKIADSVSDVVEDIGNAAAGH